MTHHVCNCTLMAFREPLNNMLWEETSVHTGLSWARIVLTFCRVWMSHTYARHTAARHTTQRQNHLTYANNSNKCKFDLKKRMWMLLTMMVQSAEPLYSLFLWRQKKKRYHRVILCGLVVPSWLASYDHNVWRSFACVCFITPGCTEPVRCHHDPRGFSDTCRWCRCPIPEGEKSPYT